MLLRRIAGSLLTLLVLHLNVLGADFSCAKHGPVESDTNSAMVMPATGATHEHGHAQSAATVQETALAVDSGQPPCDVPVQPTCCKALASCGVFYSAGDELDVADLPYSQQMIALDAMNLPASERAAPEPPPPKA